MDNFPSIASLGGFPSNAPIDDTESTAPTGEFSSAPITPTPTYDIRQQIIANALVMFPTIVNEHATKFPKIPVPAEDIFNVCVLITDETDPDNARVGSSRAMLTHTDGINVLRKPLLIGEARLTAADALEDLLGITARALGSNYRTILRLPEGVFEMITATTVGSENNGNTIHGAVEFASNMGKTRSTTSPKALWQKCKKAMHRRQAR